MLEHQVMLKQLQELQRQKKLQAFNNARQQNFMDQLSSMHNKQSGAKSGPLNNAIPVREPSKIFKFGDQTLVQSQSQGPQSIGFASFSLVTKHESEQAGTFRKSFIGGRFNASSKQDVATLDRLEQKVLVNTEDNSWGTKSFNNSSDLPSLQSGSLSAHMQSASAEASSSDSRPPYFGLRFAPSSQRPLLSVKTEDGQQSSTFEAKQHIWVDVPVPQNLSGKGSCERSSTSMKDDSSVRAGIKNESVNCDNKIFQTTSLCQLNSAYGDHSYSISFKPPLQDKVPFWLKNNEASKTKYDARIGNSSLLQVASTDQCGTAGLITGMNEASLTHPPSISMQPSDVANQNRVVLKSKKRKFSSFECLPWHKEVTEGWSRLHNISTAELEWALYVGRLPEKVKEEAAEIGDSFLLVHRKRRLNLTTQLMQLLFRPAPAIVLSEDATAHFDTVTYYAARLALGDACSLYSASMKNMTSKRYSEDLSKIIEGFIDRLKRLYDKLSRLEKGGISILEARIDFQDLEKFSVVNRLAKFHIRGPKVKSDAASSGSCGSSSKLHTQKYVKASPMPTMIPEGENCISL